MTSPWTILLLCFFSGVNLHELSGCQDKGCSHGCEDKVIKGPTCTCPEGMVLALDKLKCQQAVTLLLGLFRGISQFSEGSGKYDVVFPGKTTTLDFHYARREIFTYSNNSIYRSSLKKPNGKPTVVLTPETMVTSLAVDWEHDDLLWVSQQRSAVEAASINTTNNEPRVIAQLNDTDKPGHWHNLVTDPYVRKLFWLGDSQVFSAGLDGSKLQSRLPGAGLERPEDMALDTRNQLMYVIGSRADGRKAVVRSKYDGSQAEEIIVVDQPCPIYGFGVLGRVLYWQSSTDDAESLYKCTVPRLGEKTKVELVEEINQIVYDMKVYHPDIQKKMKK